MKQLLKALPDEQLLVGIANPGDGKAVGGPAPPDSGGPMTAVPFMPPFGLAPVAVPNSRFV